MGDGSGGEVQRRGMRQLRERSGRRLVQRLPKREGSTVSTVTNDEVSTVTNDERPIRTRADKAGFVFFCEFCASHVFLILGSHTQARCSSAVSPRVALYTYTLYYFQ